MKTNTYSGFYSVFAFLVTAFLFVPLAGSAEGQSDTVADALSAGWPGMAANAHLMVPIGPRD